MTDFRIGDKIKVEGTIINKRFYIWEVQTQSGTFDLFDETVAKHFQLLHRLKRTRQEQRYVYRNCHGIECVTTEICDDYEWKLIGTCTVEIEEE